MSRIGGPSSLLIVRSYFKDFISSPVANDVTIRMLFVLMLLGNMHSWVMDVNGVFLLGLFQAGE